MLSQSWYIRAAAYLGGDAGGLAISLNSNLSARCTSEDTSHTAACQALPGSGDQAYSLKTGIFLRPSCTQVFQQVASHRRCSTESCS